jgi:heme oxygenase
MLLDKLRTHTASAHQQLEKLLVPRIKQATSAEAYKEILQLFYGYFKPLEDKIEKYIDSTLLSDYEERRKAAAIVADINYLSGLQGPFKLCTNLPAIDNSRQAIGALYVMEGSTLGGKVIKSILMKNLDMDGTNGFSFFGGYGDDTPVKWQVFTSTLNEKFSDPATHEDVLLAAHDTFIKFKSWAEEN